MALWKIGRGMFIALCVFWQIFLLAPIVVIVVVSFTSANYMTFPPPGFSLVWFGKVAGLSWFWNSLATSLIVAVVSTVIATAVGVVAARRDKCGGPRLVAIEDRDDDGDVRQMRAAAVGVVQDIGVAAADAAPVRATPACFDDGADAFAHRAQVHRNVRRVGDQRSALIEHGAGKIEPLLDVDAGRG